MFGFLLRKFFYDLWDNLYRVALINLGFLISLAIPTIIPSLLDPVTPLALTILALGILWCFVYLSAAALSLKAISDYSSFSFSDFVKNLKNGCLVGFLLGFLAFAAWLLVTLVIPFYFGVNSFLGLFLGCLIFWALIIGLLALQFCLPIRSRLDTKLPKIIKKCFIILMDNPLFCTLAGLFTLFLLALSIPLLLLAPGPAGILLFLDEALRLRLLKYDWLEANPGANQGGRRPQVPWEALLIEDREKTGTRSLKNLIFPWKD